MGRSRPPLLTCRSVPICILNLAHWESARIHICGPMHQAILTERPNAAGDSAVVLKASCDYGITAIRFKLASVLKPMLETAIDCCFWLLPNSYLKMVAEHIGYTSFPRLLLVADNMGVCSSIQQRVCGMHS